MATQPEVGSRATSGCPAALPPVIRARSGARLPEVRVAVGPPTPRKLMEVSGLFFLKKTPEFPLDVQEF